MKAAVRLSIGVIAVMTLMTSHRVMSAPSVQHGEAERAEVELSASAATLLTPAPPASHSAFLPTEEGRLLALTNRERAVRGLPPLFLDLSLRDAARAHARDMAMWGYIGHTSRYGLGVRDRMAQFVRPGRRIGENLAFVQSIDQGHVAFVGSVAHRQNMLNPAFRRVGIGVATMGEAGLMIAEDFADSAVPRLQPSPHRAWPIHRDSSTSSASMAPLTRSRSAR